MSQQKGANVEILLGYESVFKTAPADGFALPINSFGLQGSQPLNSAQTLTGTRNPVAPFVGNRDVSGSIVVPADSVAMWYWLKAMFGDPATTGSDPYVHEFKIGNTMPSLTLEAAFTDLAADRFQRYVGCKVSDFSLDIGGDGELTLTINIIGSTDTLETSAFDAAPTAISLARVHNYHAVFTEGGGALSNATSLSINVDFGLDTDMYVIGSAGTRGSLPEGIVSVSGTLATLFEADTLLAKGSAQTESAIKATMTSSASSILEFEFQELLYERSSPRVEGPQGMLVNLNWHGYYTDGSEASAIVARLTNGDEHA